MRAPPWSAEEVERFAALWEAGAPVSAIATALGRTYGSVILRRGILFREGDARFARRDMDERQMNVLVVSLRKERRTSEAVRAAVGHLGPEASIKAVARAAGCNPRTAAKTLRRLGLPFAPRGSGWPSIGKPDD